MNPGQDSLRELRACFSLRNPSERRRVGPFSEQGGRDLRRVKGKSLWDAREIGRTPLSGVIADRAPSPNIGSLR